MGPVAGPNRKPVIVEHALVAHDDDVIAGMAGRWPNPLCLETAVRIPFEERVRQHVTRAGGEEYAIGERPLFDGIALCARCASFVHPERTLTLVVFPDGLDLFEVIEVVTRVVHRDVTDGLNTAFGVNPVLIPLRRSKRAQ